MSVNLRRELSEKTVDDITKYFDEKDSKRLLNILLGKLYNQMHKE